MKGYDVVNSEGYDERSPPRLELAEQYREVHPIPHHSPNSSLFSIINNPSSFYNGHLQCPLQACASDGAGCDDIDPRPS